QALNVHAAERRGVDPVAKLLRPDVTHEVRARIRMTVRMTIETRDPQAGDMRPSVICEVELLLRKRGHEQPHAIELLGTEDVFEQAVEVLRGDELSLRYIAEIRAGREKDRRWKLGKQVLGE